MLHMFCFPPPLPLSGVTYIFANEVLLILYDAPRSDADSADLAPWLGGVVFQRITHMANHSWWEIVWGFSHRQRNAGQTGAKYSATKANK